MTNTAATFSTDRLNRSLWLEPAFIALVLVGSLAVTPPPGVAVDWRQLQQLIGWYLTPVLDVHLAVLGIVGGLVVAVAVMTGFGSNQTATDARYRSVLELTLGVSALFLLFMAACAVRVAIYDGMRWPEVVIALVLTWIIALTARLALGKRSLQHQSAVAQREWRRRRARAQAYGIRSRDEIRATTKTILLACLVPALPWILISSAMILTSEADDPWRLVAILFFNVGAYLGHIMLSVLWLCNRDVSAPTLERALPAVVFSVLALGLAAACTVPLVSVSGMPVRWVIFGCLAFAVVVVHATSLLTPLRRKIPWIREAEDAVTVRALRRSRKKAKRLANSLLEGASRG